MPELPEVETYVRELEPLLRERQVVGAQVFWSRTIAAPPAESFAACLIGQRFTRFGRRGKYMLLGLESGDTLIVHLRMTGHLVVYASPVARDKHTHVVLDLDDGGQVHFQDARKFGRIWLVAEPAEVLAKLGPEPLDEHFTPAALAAQLAGRRAPIKSLLLDQRIVAGIGNIYADEALFRAGIHPLRSGGALTEGEMTQLHGAIQATLAAAVAQHGSSLGASSVQNFLRPNGEFGSYQDAHAVYHRAGLPCLRCGALVERTVVGQRSTHYCPACQV